MNTIILFWNPGISSYTIERLREDLSNHAHVSNWSVWEHEKAHKGDRFFMVRCGDGKTGICMSGRFRSEPYRGEDWSGKGREVYYMDLLADVVIDPDACPILSTAELQSLIPEFKWDGGHSGRLLPEKDALVLEDKWIDFLDEHNEIFIHHTYKNDDIDDYFEKTEEKEHVRIEPAFISLDPNSTYIITDYTEEVEVAGDDLEKLKAELEEKMQAEGLEKPTSYEFADISEEDQQLFARMVLMARDAYKDMSYCNREPYWTHVASRTYYEGSKKMIMLLSGILKHPDYTTERLIQSGVPKMIVESVDAMTQRDGETLERYIARLLKNPPARHILDNELYDELTGIVDFPSLTTEDVERINRLLQIRQRIEKAREDSYISVFHGKLGDFKRWAELHGSQHIAIEGRYTTKGISKLAKVLEVTWFQSVDISKMTVKYDGDIEEYADSLVFRMTEMDEELNVLEKMILNQKYSSVFVRNWNQIVTEDGKVLVHVPVDCEPRFEKGIEIVGCAAVANNKKLRALIYPNGLTAINDYAFSDCENLVSVRLPDTVTRIGKGCFHSCCIGDLVLSKSLTEIPHSAFFYNVIEHLVIPSSVKRIGSEAFQLCYIGDDDLTIPEGVEVIEYNAFSNPFEHVYLPSTLKEIAYDFYFEEMIDDAEEWKPYVEIHPDNPVFYSKNGILYRRDTGKEALGKAGREQYLLEQKRNL